MTDTRSWHTPLEPGVIGRDDVLDALWQLPEVGLAVVDRELRLVRVNDTLARISGMAPEAHIGRSITEVVPDLAATAVPHLRAVLTSGRPLGLVLQGETDAALGRGRRRSERYLPVFADGETPIGVLAILHELGEGEVLRAELEERDHQLRLAVEAGGLGVWDWDAATGQVRWSPELERLFGMAPGRFDGTFDGYIALVHPDDRAAVVEAIQRSVRLGEAHHVEHRLIVDHEQRWIEGRGAVVRDSLGHLVGMRGVALDVTDRKCAEEGLRREMAVLESLADLARTVGASRDRASVARAVAEAARRHCHAAWAAVLVDGGVDWTVVAASEDVGEGTVDASTATLAATATLGAAAARASHELAVVRLHADLQTGGAGPGAVLVAPMRDAVALLGALVVAYPHPPSSIAPDEQILATIAAHAMVLLENARLHEAARQEIAARQAALDARDRVARVLQRSLLPPELPAIPSIDLAARYLPLTEDIGGDFYDTFPLGGHDWAIVIGDVEGKGPEAAAITAHARYTLRTAAVSQGDPGTALRVLNTSLAARGPGEGRFCTAVVARVHPRRARAWVDVAVAGHPPVLILRHDGQVDQVGPTGPLLGVLDEVEIGNASLALAPGDACIFYTDGATDVRHDNRTFGETALLEVVAGCRGLPAAAIAASIEDAVLSFQQGEMRDDLALLVLRVPPYDLEEDDPARRE